MDIGTLKYNFKIFSCGERGGKIKYRVAATGWKRAGETGRQLRRNRWGRPQPSQTNEQLSGWSQRHPALWGADPAHWDKPQP